MVSSDWLVEWSLIALPLLLSSVLVITKIVRMKKYVHVNITLRLIWRGGLGRPLMSVLDIVLMNLVQMVHLFYEYYCTEMLFQNPYTKPIFMCYSTNTDCCKQWQTSEFTLDCVKYEGSCG